MKQERLVVIREEDLLRTIDERVYNALMEVLKHQIRQHKELTEQIYVLKSTFTVKDACKYLGVSKATLGRMYRGQSAYAEHPLPYKKIGQQIFFAREEIDAWREGLPR